MSKTECLDLPLSSKNDLKKGPLQIICFLNMIEREHSRAPFNSYYNIVKKVSSSFRGLHQKIYDNIALNQYSTL